MALHLAAQGDHAEVCTLLLSRGALLNVKDTKGRYPIALATHERMKAVLEAKTEQATLLQPPQPAAATPGAAFDALIYFQEPGHATMFSGLAAESHKSALLTSLMDAMVEAARLQKDFKFLGASDEGIFNATIVPGLSSQSRSGIERVDPAR